MRFARQNQSLVSLPAVCLLLTLGCFYSSKAVAKTDREKNELKGSVRSIVAYETFFLEQPGKLVEQKRKKYVAVTFDRQGRLIRENTCSTPADRILSLADTPLAKPIKDNLGEWRYNYNAEGRLTRARLYDLGKLICTTTYLYHSVERVVTAKREGCYDTEVYTYDAAGNVIECENKAFNQRTRYVYDKSARLIEEVAYQYANPVPRTLSTQYLYDKKGNLREIISDGPADSGVDREFHKYDDRGVLVSSESYDSNGNLTDQERYAFKFDSHGNWIKKIKRIRKLILLGGTGNVYHDYKTAIYRTITYY
jgi:YD repeat-containing protein